VEGPGATHGTFPAYVLSTYGPDQTGDTAGAVTCDVVLEDGVRTVLLGVPVIVQGSSGPVQARGAWRPTPTRRNLDSGVPLVFAPSDLSALDTVSPGQLSALDGDRVLVAYMGGSSQRPIILCGIPHPRSERRGGSDPAAWASTDDVHPVSPSGDVEWLRQAGTVVTVDAKGNAAIDTTSAPQTSAGTDPGTSPAGCVALKLKSTAHLTLRWGGGAVAVRLSQSGGNVHVELLGTPQLDIGNAGEVAAMGNAMVAKLEEMDERHVTHVHTPTAPGAVTGPPQDPTSLVPHLPVETTGLTTSSVRLPAGV